MQTTDNQAERFDLVNEADEVIGVATRGQVHHGPQLIHRSIGILVFNPEGKLFLQKRSLTKDTDPGLWCISVGGHVLSGQGYEAAARRELLEELGVYVVQLTPVAKYIISTSIETEMEYLFTAQHSGPFTLNPQETSTGEFFAPDEIQRLFTYKTFIFTQTSMVSLAMAGILPFTAKLRSRIRKQFKIGNEA